MHIGSVTDVEELGDGLYAVTTVEGNMSNSVKSYCYVYDSNKPNHMVGVEEGLKLQNNMSELPEQMHSDPLVQYELHTDPLVRLRLLPDLEINPFHPAQNAL